MKITIFVLLVFSIFLGGCKLAYSHWRVIKYQEKNIHKLGLIYMKEMPDFEKYSDYYFDTFFCAVHSDKRDTFEYESETKLWFYDINMVSNNIQNIKEIIIHNIRIISESGIDYSDNIQNNFPVIIPTDEDVFEEIYVNNENQIYTHKSNNFRKYINNYDEVFVLKYVDSFKINFGIDDKIEKINIFINIEIKYTDEEKEARKEIDFVMFPKTYSGLMRWESGYNHY